MARYSRYLLVLCAFLLAFAAAPLTPAFAEGVVIEDPALEKAIRESLDKPAGAITEADMAQLNTIFARNSQTDGQLRSLKGLEYAVNLVELDAPGNRIEDLTPLAGLSRLQYLTLSGNNVKDLSPLKSLGKLQLLSVSHNLIEDIGTLSSLQSLTDVEIDDNNVRDLSPLLELSQLRYLRMSENVVDMNDESAKAAIESLKQRNVKFQDDYSKQKAAPSAYTAMDPRFLDWTLEKSHVSFSTRDYAYGDGLYVAVGPGGIAKTSKDGIAWQTNETGYNGDFDVVVYGAGKFLAFGQQQLGSRTTDIWTSSDGVNWTENAQKIVEFAISIRDAAWNGKRFVAVGGNNGEAYIYSSDDGQKWTRQAKGLLETNITGVAWGNGTFVAAGYEGGVAAVSKDGLKWTKSKTKQPNYEQIWSLAYGGGNFVAVGDYTIMLSKDGVKWKYVASKGFWSQIDWVKDRFILLGGDWVNSGKKDDWFRIALSSKDGTKWSDAGLVNKKDPSQVPLYSLYNGKQYVSVTNFGVQTSTDGKSWKQAKRYPISALSLSMGAVGDGKMVLVGGYKDRDSVKISSLASLQRNRAGAWTGSQKQGVYPLYSAVWTGSKFLAVGSKGTMATSKDGVVWQTVASPTTESLYKVLKAGNTYYAVGAKGVILSSKDGAKWTKQKSNATVDINSIEWNGSTFVAVGEAGLILVSQDGVKWTKIYRNFRGDYYDVVWGNGKFAVSTAGLYVNIDTSTVLSSSDGKTWTESSFEDGFTIRGASTGLYGIGFAGDHFIAVGAEGSIFLSPDATHWTKQQVLVTERLNGVVTFEGKVYVVGGSGMILSAELSSLRTSQQK
ncbi:leucine-rich repeat domain-containing protein [Cohnella suwonensis]|uniref:Leucine-rich repeat domain-containing protein n=1 Tax=Cohnella suwonensis TaxID=696072 RepID=A0ABW0LUM2_9BACL